MKQILELFYVNNMTVVQISEALRIPTGTIKSILSRTRKQIKNRLIKIKKMDLLWFFHWNPLLSFVSVDTMRAISCSGYC